MLVIFLLLCDGFNKLFSSFLICQSGIFEKSNRIAASQQDKEWIVPFNITKELCGTLFKNWVKDLWFAPTDLTKTRLRGIKALCNKKKKQQEEKRKKKFFQN
jgi:hypothetical protein